MNPNFEVKLFLNPARVLDVEFRPTHEVQKQLGLGDSHRKISMQFLDSRPPRLHAEGWGVRTRVFDHDPLTEISYKYRIPIGDDGLDGVEAAVSKARGYHFDHSYAAQVEWGFDKRTLSLTDKKLAKLHDRGSMEQPSRHRCLKLALHDLPGKLDHWKREDWAFDILTDCSIFGPVFGKRWTGKWHDVKLSFETWAIKAETGAGFEPVVELSFKWEHENEAGILRDRLIHSTRENEWLLEYDVLKTELIFARY
jgi:hypothetical protein